MSNYQFIVTVKIDDPDKKAILINDGKRDAWIPRSMIERFEPDPLRENLAALTIPEWLALKKGLL